MIDVLNKTTLRTAYWRLLADFVVIHACMILALAFAVTSFTALGRQDEATLVASYFPFYYTSFFWPLSALFPAVFLLSGLYTRSYTYTPRYRNIVTLRGVGLAILIYLAANYLFFREELISRSVAIWFAILLAGAMAALRHVAAKPELDAGRRERRVNRTQENDAVLVVGGAGYIGSIMVRKLLESGTKVRLLDRLVYGYSSIEGILGHPNLELIVGDCRNIQSVVSAVRGVNTIIDLAAIVGDPACEEDRLTALETNYAATRMLIEVAKGFRVPHFIFASSCSVYGANDSMADERSAVHPISLYAHTKVDSEQALLHARSEFFHPTILRLSTVFGYSWRPRFDLVVNLLTAKAFQEGVITIFNGNQWRPFIHVDDVARAFIHVKNAPLGVVSGQVYNVGGRNLNYTLSDVAERIRHEFPDTRVENVDNADRRNYRVSFQKIQNQLGFECQRTLEEGIRELKLVFEQKKVTDYRDIYYDNKKFLQVIGTSTHADETDARVMAAFSNLETVVEHGESPARLTPHLVSVAR